jgi:3-hydroxyisobutyrate dehydrogenase-like beta-hydroxyacid dehydrogenase
MSRRTRKNIGLVGLGLIGNRVREVLRHKGFQVFVWNRTPRPVPNFVGAPAELAEMCDFIQIFVSDDDALLFVVKQLSPALATRHIVIAHPTVSPQTMTQAAQIVERRGARFIEAPFTGSKEAAEKGELVYYVAGEPEVIREARPLLEASSKELLELGSIGQATAIKVATNMVTAATVQAAAEALALVQSTGLPVEKFAAAMQQNASYSKTLAMKLPKMIKQNYERHFSVQHMLKDMQIASRLGLTNHLELAVTAAARDRLMEQMQRGHGDEDYSAVARKYAMEAGKAGAEPELELFQRLAAEPKEEMKPSAGVLPESQAAHPQSQTAETVLQQIEPVSELPKITEPPKVVTEERSAAIEQKMATVEAKAEPLVNEQSAGAGERVIPPGPALEALQTHVPAAPFLNPVETAEPVPQQTEPVAADVAAHASNEFLPEAGQQSPEPEQPPNRGFFSRLLRGAKT